MAWQSEHNDWVEWRLAHGSLCYACPLNGQRKVGCDGPSDAPLIQIAEAPSADEEKHGRAEGAPYGRPLVGKSGYLFKVRALAPAGLATLSHAPRDKWPRVRSLNVFLMN